MKPEYDFSKGERGKFFSADAALSRRMMAERAARADRSAFDAVMAATGPEAPRDGDEIIA